MKQIILIYFTILFLSTNTIAGPEPWDIHADTRYYETLYKNFPGLAPSTIGNIAYAHNTNEYKSFTQAIEGLPVITFDKIYVYYELNVNNNHYFFMWIGVNEDTCVAFHTTSGAEIKVLPDCRDLKIVVGDKHAIVDQIMLDATFSGLYASTANTTPIRIGVLNSHINLINNGTVFEKIEVIFGNKE